jgi:hypothetical protein
MTDYEHRERLNRHHEPHHGRVRTCCRPCLVRDLFGALSVLGGNVETVEVDGRWYPHYNSGQRAATASSRPVDTPQTNQTNRAQGSGGGKPHTSPINGTSRVSKAVAQYRGRANITPSHRVMFETLQILKEQNRTISKQQTLLENHLVEAGVFHLLSREQQVQNLVHQPHK